MEKIIAEISIKLIEKDSTYIIEAVRQGEMTDYALLAELLKKGNHKTTLALLSTLAQYTKTNERT